MQPIDDGEVDALLRLFAVKVQGHAVVLALDLAAATLVIERAGVEHRLHLRRPTLAAGLEDMRRGNHPWEAGVSPPEALARLMLVHLDESMATRSRDETGWWSYDGAFFHPRPPWEAPPHRRNR